MDENKLTDMSIPEGFELESTPETTMEIPDGFELETDSEDDLIEEEKQTYISEQKGNPVVNGLKDAFNFVTQVPVAGFSQQSQDNEAAELRTKGILLRADGKDLTALEKERIKELDNPYNSGKYNQANNYGIISHFKQTKEGKYFDEGAADVQGEKLGNMIKTLYAETSKQVAIMWDIGKEAGPAAVAGGIVGAVGGLVGEALTTRNLAAAPQSAGIGFKAGASLVARTAVAKKSFELEAGFMRQELEQLNMEFEQTGVQPLSDKEMDTLAASTGLINAALEYLGVSAIVSAIPSGDKVLKSMGKDKVLDLIKGQQFRNELAEFTTKLAIAGIEEGSTEMLQETTNFIAGNLARDMRNVAPKPLADKLDEILQAGLVGAVTSILMGGVGTATQVANVKIRQGLDEKTAKKEAAEMPLDERIRFTNDNISTLASIATQEADNKLETIQAGETYTRYKDELQRQGATEEVADQSSQLVEQIHNIFTSKYGKEGQEQLKNSDLQILIDQNNKNQVLREEDFVATTPEVNESNLQTFKPEELQTDAATFQYKEDSDAQGVTSRLKGVEKFDPLYSGKIIVYETKDGQKFVVDGHQRLGLAKRLNDPSIRLQGYVFKEADGYTPQDVRVMAAQKNIAEGSGTAVDTAKIIREVGVENMPASISKNSALYKEGVSLARLGDEAFQKVINKEIKMNYAARVADAIREDEQKQALAIDAIAKGVAEGKITNEEMAYGVATQINSADTVVSEQTNLFGTQEFAETLVYEKAQVVDKAIKSLKLDKNSLSAAVRNKGKLEKVGGNKVDEESSKAVIAETNVAKAIIEKLAYTSGDISNKVNELTMQYKNGEITLEEAANQLNEYVKSEDVMKQVAELTSNEIETNVVKIAKDINNNNNEVQNDFLNIKNRRTKGVVNGGIAEQHRKFQKEISDKYGIAIDNKALPEDLQKLFELYFSNNKQYKPEDMRVIIGINKEGNTVYGLYEKEKSYATGNWFYIDKQGQIKETSFPADGISINKKISNNIVDKLSKMSNNILSSTFIKDLFNSGKDVQDIYDIIQDLQNGKLGIYEEEVLNNLKLQNSLVDKYNAEHTSQLSYINLNDVNNENEFNQEPVLSDDSNEETVFTPYEFYKRGFYQDTAEVYLPETEYFKTWFKDSKVVDEDGKPLVVYHGTSADFNAFDYDKIGTNGTSEGVGFYFTDDESTAEGYTRRNGKILKCYLSIQKPLEYDSHNLSFDDIKNIIKKAAELQSEEYEEDVKDSFVSNYADTYSMDFDYAAEEAASMIYSEEKTDTDMLGEIAYSAGSKFANKATTLITGYDGIITNGYNNAGQGGGNFYIPFNPEQIKSVDNVGTFNPNSPNIFEQSAAPEVTDTPQFKYWFDDSKVVDEFDNPIELYHGSVNTFEIFDKEKASPEGDMGSGFYFTDNIYDADDNYHDGGPDFDNKVSRLAEQLEAESDTLTYEEAKEIAVKQLKGDPHLFSVYLKMKNPCYVGENETILFADIEENIDDEDLDINREDFDSDEEYEDALEEARYEAKDEALADILNDVENAVVEIMPEYNFNDSINKFREIINEAAYDGGISLEDLKKRLNEEAFEGENGDFIANELARRTVEALGYDGIIDSTVSEKFNMNIPSGTKHYIVFEPTQIKEVSNRGTFDPSSPNIFEQSAWNGSPSKFERFSTDFIGTGEGNQAHGWGIYFAGNRDVSEGYRKRLTKAKLKIDGTDVILKGHKFINKETLEPYFKNDLEDSYLDTFVTVLGFTNKDTKAAVKFIKNEIEKNKDNKLVTEDLENTLKFIEDKNIEYIENQGQLYEADIPETDVMLDEDKTFAEQPEKVQAAIKKMAENPFAYPFKNFVSGELKTGKDFYNELALDLGISDSLTGKGAENYDKLASEFLNKIGIEGITYDGARDGRCFVVFDDKAIRIMNTYYQFAGENSQTADQNSLSNAKSMLKKGTPAGVVREETGWFIGADGKWRYEISDDDAILDEDIARYREPEKVIDVEEYENKIKEIEKPLEEIRKEYYDENISHSEMMAESQKYWDKSAPLKEAIENYQREVRGLNVHKLGDILEHEKLYAAYPELRNLRVVFQPDNNVYYGMFSSDTLYLTQKAVDEGNIKATLMHEIQHYIQGKERFATGGNTSNIKADIEHGLIKLQRTEGGREYYNKIFKWEDLSEEEARIAKALQVAKVAENPEHLFKTGWWAKNGTMFKPKKTSKDYKAFVEEWFEKYNDSIRESLETPLDIDRHREYMEMDIKELQKLYNNTRAKEKYAYQNIMNFKTKNSELVTHIETLKKAVSELQQAYQAENDYEVGKLSLDDYKRLAGEVEARNTEARMNMTESERKANDYTKTQDVSNADQLIVFSDGSTVPFSAASMEGSQGPKKSNGPRGRFRIDENGGAIIEVLENGDASTIVHELGHYYLYSLEQLAQKNKRAEKDLKAIYEYLGREEGVEYSYDQQVEFHEKFARSFEAYLLNGNAPTKKMKTVFEHFKEWLKGVYNSLKDLNVDFSEDSIKLFDRIFTTDEEYEKEVLPKYEYNYKKTVEIEQAKNNPMYQLRKFVDDTKTGISTWYDKLFLPIDSRLAKISPELAMKLRKHTAALSLIQGKDFKIAADFFKAVTKMKKKSEQDYYMLDLALKNRDSYTTNKLANKYGFTEQLEAVRDMLDEIRDDALEVGIDVGYLENYYPREVKRDMLDRFLAYLDALKHKEDVDVAKQILSPDDAQISLIMDEMKREKGSEFWTQEDIAKYINSKLRGFGRNNILLSRGGSLKKSRAIDELDGDFNQFYEPLEVALVNYISSARKTLEARKFFGNENKEVGKLRARMKRKKATLKEVQGRTPSQAKYKEMDRIKYELAPIKVKLSSLQKQEDKTPELQELQERLEKQVDWLENQLDWLESASPFLVKGVVVKRMKTEISETAEEINEILGDTKHIEDSIGQLVKTLAENGDIIAKDEKAIREMLTARFAAQSLSDPVRILRDMTYIATLNDITNALTQFGDLAFAVYKYGFKDTAKALGKPFGIRKEDLGLNDMAHEFANPSALSKWIKKQFTWIGLDKIDGMGKNTLIQAAILNAQEKIKKNDKVFDEKLKRIFGEDSEQVKKELLSGETTDNTIVFAFHELADIQPISEDQTPELYNNGGGFMRLFYTLKTYGIKALDIARQDVTIKIEQGIKNKDKKMIAEGLNNLIRLQMLLWLFGVPIDALKDLLSNRDINLLESFIDSLIPAFLVNRYAFRTADREGVGAAIVDYFTPSMASVIEKTGKSYAVTNIPFIGKPLYNWLIK